MIGTLVADLMTSETAIDAVYVPMGLKKKILMLEYVFKNRAKADQVLGFWETLTEDTYDKRRGSIDTMGESNELNSIPAPTTTTQTEESEIDEGRGVNTMTLDSVRQTLNPDPLP